MAEEIEVLEDLTLIGQLTQEGTAGNPAQLENFETDRHIQEKRLATSQYILRENLVARQQAEKRKYIDQKGSFDQRKSSDPKRISEPRPRRWERKTTHQESHIRDRKLK